MDFIIKILVVLTSFFVLAKMLYPSFAEKRNIFNVQKKIQLLVTGFIANICDTLGLGSFAVIVALNNRWKLVDDKKLPGVLNSHSVLPAMLQSLLFLNFVELDISLLISFVSAACLGGFFGGYLVAKLSKQSIRFAMSIGFAGVALLILGRQLNLLPVGGDETSLSYGTLIVGIPAMIFAGMLPSIGVGIYVPIQVIMFLLGFSPLVAFPVMTTAGALVQSVTGYAFIVRKEVPIGESLLLGLAGVVGVLVAVPLITYVNVSLLRWLLFVIVVYNAQMMWKAYQQDRARLAKV